MGREELVAERMRQLHDVARFYEWVAASLLVALVAGGVLLADPARAAAVSLLAGLGAAASGLQGYRVRRRLESKWAVLVKEDPEWAAKPGLHIALLALAMAAAIIALRLLLG